MARNQMKTMADNDNDGNPVSNKRLRLADDREDNISMDLFELYSGDFGQQLISFASAAELCKLDLLSKDFRGLTTKIWTERTYERFGMKNGKDGWRMGTSFLREPVYFHIHQHPTYGDMYYAGSPHVTANDSLIAIDTDDGDDGEGYAPVGTGIYDATDLSYLGPRQGGGWQSVLAGPKGNELLVTSMSNRLDFRREAITHRQHYQNNRNPEGIFMIASETHVVLVIGNTLHLYKLVSDDRLVELCQSKPLGRNSNDGEYYNTSIAWGEDRSSEFIVYHCIRDSGAQEEDEAPVTSTITVWTLDTEADDIIQAQTIGTRVILREVVLGEDFIVGSCGRKMIHVWDRHTEEKTQDLLCDIEEDDDQLSPIDINYHLQLSFHGHILVTTSHIGVAICIWNVKTGSLLKRLNNADEERRVDMLPDGIDATSMAYVKPLNGYICTSGYLDVWVFPTNQQQYDKADMIQDREKEVERDWLNSSDSSNYCRSFEEIEAELGDDLQQWRVL